MTLIDSKDSVTVWKCFTEDETRTVLYHVVEDRNDSLKCMKVLTEGGVEAIYKCRRITSMNLPNTRKHRHDTPMSHSASLTV